MSQLVKVVYNHFYIDLLFFFYQSQSITSITCKTLGFFFQNNTKTQTVLLVSTFSKLFRKLTSRVQGSRFCCAKLSILNSSCMHGNRAL